MGNETTEVLIQAAKFAVSIYIATSLNVADYCLEVSTSREWWDL